MRWAPAVSNRTGRPRLLRRGRLHFSSLRRLVILPRSPAHTLKSVERAPRGTSSEILQGLLEFDAPDHPLFSVLPPIIHATPQQLQENSRYGLYLESLKDEVLTSRDGSDALAARLTEALLIEVMRFFTPPPGVECPSAVVQRLERSCASPRARSHSRGAEQGLDRRSARPRSRASHARHSPPTSLA